CIVAIAASGASRLTIVSNNCGNQGKGLAILLKQRQVAKVVGSYVGGNPDLEQQMLAGEVEVELNPQGTLAERMRAGGAGIEAFFTPTGAGTVVAEGKETRTLNGRLCVLEAAIRTDFAIVRAAQGDPFGNLRFYRTARNFNPLAAMAGRITIAEVDELVPLGALDPDDIHLPGIYVDRVIHVPVHNDFIEFRTTRPRGGSAQ
ncbi:MAG: CoA transferase subunit A, partial [Nannocystaceae bacterium]